MGASQPGHQRLRTVILPNLRHGIEQGQLVEEAGAQVDRLLIECERIVRVPAPAPEVTLCDQTGVLAGEIAGSHRLVVLLDGARLVVQGQANVAQGFVETSHLGRLTLGRNELCLCGIKFAPLGVKLAQPVVQVGHIDQRVLVDCALQMLHCCVEVAVRMGDLSQTQQGQQIAGVFGQGSLIVLLCKLPLLAGNGRVAQQRLAVRRQPGRVDCIQAVRLVVELPGKPLRRQAQLGVEVTAAGRDDIAHAVTPQHVHQTLGSRRSCGRRRPGR